MRLAEAADTIKLINTYQDATTYANAVGRIDWPDPIAELFVADLVASGELYCFEEGDDILAAAKLSRQRNYQGSETYAYGRINPYLLCTLPSLQRVMKRVVVTISVLRYFRL